MYSFVWYIYYAGVTIHNIKIEQSKVEQSFPGKTTRVIFFQGEKSEKAKNTDER